MTIAEPPEKGVPYQIGGPNFRLCFAGMERVNRRIIPDINSPPELTWATKKTLGSRFQNWIQEHGQMDSTKKTQETWWDSSYQRP